jgi:O-antigen biosynthesis protein WbqV
VTTKSPIPHQFSQWLAYAYDVAISSGLMATVLIWRYRFEPKPLPSDMVWRATVAFAVITAVVYPLIRLHRGLWRFTTLSDVLRIAQAVAFANLVLIPTLFITDRLTDFPRTGLLIEAPLLVLILTASRLAVRVWRRGDLAAALRFEDRSAPWAVIVGDHSAAADYLSELRRLGGQRFRFRGVITASEPADGGLIDGVEVLGGLDRLGAVLQASAEDGPEVRVILAELRPGRELMQLVVAAAAETGARVVRRRGPGALASPVEAADLLDRPPRRLNHERAAALISGRNVMVTGAGGTIGSELTRQVLALGPASVAVVDASEYNLYAIDMALREAGAPPVWRVELADVRDRVRMEQLFRSVKPDLVLHAAALKHVPLMETHPSEAVLTNIAGARIVAELARDHASVFVFISTDKAVNPTNVMGATKRVAERTVRAICSGSRTRAAIVRFGNVLGSTGSVAPLFERQIVEGGPITVTDPQMVRYFMTVQEAASLVLQAAALPADESGTGGVFVLDMGDPVRIDDLARQMILLHGLRPDKDIAIAYTGLRPGEKLYEEIFYADEAVHRTDADGVFSAYERPSDWADLVEPVEALITAAWARDDTETLRRLGLLVPEFVRTPNRD